MEVLRGATRWKFLLQTSRTFLNQNVWDQTVGKPNFRDQHFRVNPNNSHDYEILSGCSWFFAKFWPYIQFFYPGIRIWGQKIQNFRARKEKLRKTNVNLTPLPRTLLKGLSNSEFPINSKGIPRFLGMFWGMFGGVLAVFLEVVGDILGGF